MGVVSALVFANLGAAYGTAKSGVGIVSVAVLRPDLLFKSIIPVVMAGVLGMYGMIVAILLKGSSKSFFLLPPVLFLPSLTKQQTNRCDRACVSFQL